MTKSRAVASAVGAQLHHEKHWPPNDLNKVMGADYRYTINTISLFLRAVRAQLKNGSPSYMFTFDNAFATAALTASVSILIGRIIRNTT